MNNFFLPLIILVALYNQASAQVVKIRERTDTESHKEVKEAKFYTKRQIQVDPLWMIRGTMMVSLEHTIGDLFSARVNLGVCTRDYMDNILVDGPLSSSSINYLGNTPQLAYGLEMRYYYNENASFDSPYFSLGFSRRSYQYRVRTNYTIYNQYVESAPTAKSFDIYARYGSTLTILEREKSTLLFEYGFSVGFSIDKYSTFNGQYMSADNTINRWLLPHAGLGFTF